MGKIFWGLIFVFFHFRLNGLDLLPDFVGYLLIAAGMNELRQSELLSKTWEVAIGAAIFTGVLWLTAFGGGISGSLGVWMGLGALALRLLVTYRIAQGVEELEDMGGQNLGAYGLRTAWIVMAVASLGGFLLGFFAAMLSLMASVVSLGAAIYYIVKIHQCRQVLAERRLDSHEP